MSIHVLHFSWRGMDDFIKSQPYFLSSSISLHCTAKRSPQMKWRTQATHQHLSYYMAESISPSWIPAWSCGRNGCLQVAQLKPLCWEGSLCGNQSPCPMYLECIPALTEPTGLHTGCSHWKFCIGGNLTVEEVCCPIILSSSCLKVLRLKEGPYC